MHRIVKCNENDFATLAEIWERSVRATHDFLDESSITEIKARLIPEYFSNVDIYSISDNSCITGFIGLNNEMIEMLFIDSCFRGCGFGSRLIDFAKDMGAKLVDVNEQNTLALAFYTNKGFRIIGRDETDDAGRAYPILHMSL